MKSWTNFTVILLSLMLTFTFSCEKEATAPQQEISLEVETFYAVLLEAENKTGVQLGLTITDLQALLTAQDGHSDLTKSIPSCVDYCDLESFLACFGSSAPECLIWDFDESGTVTAADLSTFLGLFGCPDPVVVPAISAVDGTGIPIQVAVDGLIKNQTLINGVLWNELATGCNIEQARWYFDGVPVSNNIGSIQLEYPGADPADYDVAIDCNKGWHEIRLHVLVDGIVYIASSCVGIKIYDDTPNCTEDYCN